MLLKVSVIEVQKPPSRFATVVSMIYSNRKSAYREYVGHRLTFLHFSVPDKIPSVLQPLKYHLQKTPERI